MKFIVSTIAKPADTEPPGVGEYKDGALAWLTAGREFGYRDIDFDPEFFGWMRDEITKFCLSYTTYLPP